MGWYADIKELTEKTGEQRNEFVRRTHARSLSGNSFKAASIGGSSDGAMEEDEADRMPYSSEQLVRGDPVAPGTGHDAAAVATGAVLVDDHDDARPEAGWRPPQRPSPGGRFPSDVNVDRGLHASHSPSSGGSLDDRTSMAAASALPGSGIPFASRSETRPVESTPTKVSKNEQAGAAGSAYPTGQATHPNLVPGLGAFDAVHQHGGDGGREGEWLAPAAAGVGGAAVVAGIVDRHKKHQEPKPVLQDVDSTPIPVARTSSIAVPGPVAGATSLTDSPTHTHPATTSSQGDTVETLSSVPTSAEQNDVQPQASSYFGKNGAWVVAHTNPESSSREAPASQMDKVEVLGLRPSPKTANSVSTISDLHIPGGYPFAAS
jgi:hypothetical protein